MRVFGWTFSESLNFYESAAAKVIFTDFASLSCITHVIGVSMDGAGVEMDTVFVYAMAGIHTLKIFS